MLSKFLRLLALLAYAAVVLGVFVVSGYVAFNQFVRRGVTAVPELGGLSEGEARALVTDQGLVLERLDGTEAYDDEIPRGQVRAQDPAAGSLVKRGGRVEIALSLGPERVEVPDVGGRALHAAQVTLTAAGLTVGRTLGVYSEEAVAGSVVGQDPPAGESVGKEVAVTLFLSRENRGRTYVMPDLVYRRHEAARAFFSRRGFRFGRVKFEPYEGVAPGTVLRQLPLAGHPLHPGDLISLVVSTVEPAAASAS